jgi:hypothetical protein
MEPFKPDNIPQIDDPYVGKVYGNVLDNYAVPTYNLKLYMMTKQKTEDAVSGTASFDESLTGSPADIVILAQTGVTATTIDDLTIESLKTTEGPNAVGVNFTITQPGAATFLDQLQLARAYLGQEADSMPIMFLEISWKGYSAEVVDSADGKTSDSPEDNEESGKPSIITRPYRWKLHLTRATAEINAGGSVYNIETKPMSTYAYTYPLFKLPTPINTSGSTITEHLTSLTDQLNAYHKDSATNSVPDEFEFDLSQLITTTTESDTAILDEKVFTNTDPKVEDINRQLNMSFAIGDAVEHGKAIAEEPEDAVKEQEKLIDGDNIKATKGMTIEKYLGILLAMNDEFYTKISRKVAIDDPESEVTSKAAFVTWYKMDAKVKQLKYDTIRSAYAYKITYIPTLYKSSRNDIIVDHKEAIITEEEYVQRTQEIIDTGGIKKSYHYLFSGLNDQILNLDIKYDTGIALLVPPKGGAIGAGADAQSLIAGSVGLRTDVTAEGVIKAVTNKTEEANLADQFSSFLDDITALAGQVQDGKNAASGFMQSLSDMSGLDDNTIKDAIEGKNALARTALEDAIQQSDQTKKLLANNKINSSVAVESFDVDSALELSGVNYAVDLVNSLETPLTADEISALGYLQLNEEQRKTAGFEGLKPRIITSVMQAETANQSGTIKKGSLQNSLFGVIASQHSNDIGFLINLDMSLRGDPWYLGTDTLEPSNSEFANFRKNDNHFYLSIRSPKTFDMDWRDEDSEINSGYWSGDGESRTFGGIYRLIKCTNNFSGGQFTVDIQAQRIIPTNPAKLAELEAKRQAAKLKAESDSRRKDTAEDGSSITTEDPEADNNG